VLAAACLLSSLVSLLAPSAAAPAPKPPLSHEANWFLDASGRVVFLHGVNMVYKVDSYRPADAGFGRDDARFLRRNGLNTVRLGIIYKGLEPRPPRKDGTPRYRRAYVRSIARTERILARERIFSLLDFHQDMYNERFEGEGWPDWQTLDDGVPAEPRNGFPANYLFMPALQRAYDHFWANDEVAGRGLQDAYADAWEYIAKRFRERPYVMGYDLLNEPWPGSAFYSQGCGNPAGCPTFDATTLTEFSVRVIEAIRRADPSTLAFWEPLLTFDFGAETSHGDTGDEHAGFSFHDYCLPGAFGGPGSGEGCRELEELVFENADDVSERTGDVPFLTEFGATDDLATIERIVEIADQHLVSWQYWHYCDCDDPTTSGPGVQSVVIDAGKPPRGENVKREKLAVLARPYPQALNGTPKKFDFDRESRRFALSFERRSPSGEALPRRLPTELFVPRLHYRRGYEVETDGVRAVSRPGARLLRLRWRAGADAASVKIAPARK
jgi:endoglycosylceramidase